MKYRIIYGCGILILFLLAIKETHSIFATLATIENNQVSSGTWDKKEDKCKKNAKDDDKDDIHLNSGRKGDRVFWKLNGCKLKKFKHYKYKIKYHANNEDVDQEKGFQGEGLLNDNTEIAVDDLFLGSCSSGDKCTPDKYHGNMEVEVELSGDEDKKLIDLLKLTDD